MVEWVVVLVKCCCLVLRFHFCPRNLWLSQLRSILWSLLHIFSLKDAMDVNDSWSLVVSSAHCEFVTVSLNRTLTKNASIRLGLLHIGPLIPKHNLCCLIRGRTNSILICLHTGLLLPKGLLRNNVLSSQLLLIPPLYFWLRLTLDLAVRNESYKQPKVSRAWQPSKSS